ncbi:right-handed parallel beta-helix repeat-containing protein [Paenibacillus mesophilus]|uniref:right-handed parallel beta-helix repeat-containing protein n=1 Tax=Paenibacillus mesophilus TaxID=2582849 RepID=UPI00110DB6C8|nr:right-handed parallel beta-helix repeat-containing protein [Paenibacillus mesophilus]TMV45614.1 right-handed parallel beta-helix repeat-containing protein [Paenibacillus mesophilus]
MMPEQQAISRRAMLAGLGMVGLSLGLGTAAAGSAASVTKAVYGGGGAGKGNCCADCLVVTDGFTYEAVQAVLDEAEGKTVLFQPGVYTFAGGTPVIHSNTTVRACGEVVILQPNAGKFAGFAVEPGSADISIEGFDIRGPWYATGVPDWINGDMDTAIWNASYAENIGIDIRGRWYQRQILGYNAAQMQALTDVSRNITIRGCTIEGFGQSGMIVDNVDRFNATHNTIRRCGRDGIRMYGVVDGQCISNHVSTLSPGYDGAKPNYNVYGITATRLYGSSAVPDPQLTIGRPSRNVDICLNHIENAYTWKGLDTHGGVNIRFAGNTVRNAYIAIGIDKGGINDTNGKAPGRDIAVTGNTLVWDGSAPYRRAGVTAYGHDTSDALIGRNLTVTGNYMTGYGGNSTDGAVSISNFAAVSVTGNVFANTFRAALTLFNTVIDFTFTGNVVDNVELTSFQVAYGALVQTKLASGIIDGNTFRNRNQPHMSAAISLQTPEPGYGVKVGKDNLFYGAMNAKVNTVANEAGGSYFLTPSAYANVDLTAAGASLVAGKGVVSATRAAVGEVQIVLKEALSGSQSVIPHVTLKNGAAGIVTVSAVTATGFKVHVADHALAPVDSGFYLTVLGY